MQPSVGGLGQILGLQHGGPHRQVGHPGVVEQRARARIVARDRPDSSLPLARCTVTCSRQVNDVAVSATPSSATVEPSTIVGRRNRVRSGTVTVVWRTSRAGAR